MNTQWHKPLHIHYYEKSSNRQVLFKPVKTLRQTLMKTHVPEEIRKQVVYEVPCKVCSKTYVGETKWTLKVRLGEHRQAVKTGDHKNWIAVHAHNTACNWWMGQKWRRWQPTIGVEEPLKPSKSPNQDQWRHIEPRQWSAAALSIEPNSKFTLVILHSL